MSIACRTVLITGASRGLGRALARTFAEAGYRVALHFNSNEVAAQTALHELPGENHLLVQGPLAKPECARAVFARAAGGLGKVDVLINNAGIYYDHPPLSSSTEEWTNAWNEMLAVNLLAPAVLSREALAHMAEIGGGAIINISSRGAYRGEPAAPAYGASKAGLNSLTQSLALASARHGIYVYGIAPGWINTDMAAPYLEGANAEALKAQSPLGRIAEPEEIARIALFLADPDSSFMTGAIVDANGASYLR